jgi:hypothetical protein
MQIETISHDKGARMLDDAKAPLLFNGIIFLDPRFSVGVMLMLEPPNPLEKGCTAELAKLNTFVRSLRPSLY